MSNVKKVKIVAEGQWPLGQSDDFGNDAQKQDFAASIGYLTLNPVIGLHVTVEHGVRLIKPNRHGGQTNIDRITVEGQEAVRDDYLENLLWNMNGAGLNILTAIVQDVEDWPSNPTDMLANLKESIVVYDFDAPMREQTTVERVTVTGPDGKELLPDEAQKFLKEIQSGVM